MIKKLCDTKELELQLKIHQSELATIIDELNALIDKNSRVAMNQEDFKAEQERLAHKYNETKTKIDELTKIIGDKTERRVKLQAFADNLQKVDGNLDKFDEELFCSLVDKIKVYEERMEMGWKM